MAKMRLKQVEAHLDAIHGLIAEFRANAAAEKASAGGEDDNSGLGPKELEQKDQPVKQDDDDTDPSAMDSAPARGRNALAGIKGYGRIHQHHTEQRAEIAAKSDELFFKK